MFYIYVLRKTEICCNYCGAKMKTDGTTTSPPTKPATTEGFAPVNTVLEAAGPLNVRTMGSLPLSTGEENHPTAKPDEFLIQDTPMGGAN
jgi:hypothetical protein